MIKKVAVIGAGTMGVQIAQLFAQVGQCDVVLNDINRKLVDAGLATIRENLERHFLHKNLITPAESKTILNRIKGTVNLAEAVTNADFIVESVLENLEVKKTVFKQLDEQSPPDAILTSNTSNLNITEIASSTRNQSRVIGMHFFTPVYTSKMVEIVKGTLTSEKVLKTTLALSKRLGKEPLVCKDSSFGFLANRTYTAMVLEGVQMVWERVASPEDIDKALRLGYGLPIGPLALFDSLGIWQILAISEADKIKAVGPEKGTLHPLIRKMVQSGYTGGKGKKGIYDYYHENMNV